MWQCGSNTQEGIQDLIFPLNTQRADYTTQMSLPRCQNSGTDARGSGEVEEEALCLGTVACCQTAGQSQIHSSSSLPARRAAL